MKRRLCAFLAAALCAMCLTTAVLAGDDSLHTDYATITEDGFVADIFDGVPAIYNLTISSPDCLEYVQRYYREIYDLEIQAVGHNIWVTNDDTWYFERTDMPQPGDIGYATAEERERGCGHYVLCKAVDESAGTITLIEQNWIWNGQAGVNRTIPLESCYTFYTITAGDGSRPEAHEPTQEEVRDDEQRATTGAMPSAPVSAAAETAVLSTAADVLGTGEMTGTVSDWAQSAVQRAKQWGILAGTSLNANAAITRGQFARLLVNTAYGLGAWLDLSQPQTEAARLQLMMGDDQGNFNADGTLTREMAAVVLTRLWQRTGDSLAADESVLYRYSDMGAISTWAREGTAIATAAGLMDTSTLPDEGEFVTRIGTVNYDAGYVGGFYAGQYLKNEGKDSVDAVALHSGDEVSTSRRDGILAGVEAAGVTVNMLNEYHSASREESMANFEDAMTSYDKIDLVVATSAQHGMGAYSAAEAAGRDEMLIVAYDGEQEEMDAIDNGTGTYLATVTQDPAGMARTIADEVGEYIFNGATFEKFQSAPAGVYGKDGQLSAADLGIN